MSTDVLEAVGGQPAEQVAQPLQELLTPEEAMLLRFYRQLSEVEQLFMRRAIQAMTPRAVPD